jgi:hypothetical protein
VSFCKWLHCGYTGSASEELYAWNMREYWLPPRDSNPDMLIQSQLSCR